MDQLVNFIIVTGIVLIVLALVTLLRIKPKETPHVLLSIIWLVLLNIFVFFYAALNEIMWLAYLTNPIQDGVRFIIPPLVFLYVQSIFSEARPVTLKDTVHFVPFLLYLLIYIIPTMMGLDGQHLRIIENHLELALEKDVFGILYLGWSLQYFYRMKKAIREAYSSLTERDFLWIEKFLISFMAVLIIDLLLTISEFIFGYRVTWDSYLTIIALVIAISYLGLFGSTQSRILLPEFLLTSNHKKMGVKKVAPALLTEEEKFSIRQGFAELMEEKKVFLNPEINLSKLAKQLQVPEKKLSAYFKEELKSNFFDSVNAFRVEEVKRLLNTTAIKDQNIAGIGLSAGFNSKSSFYRIFKKQTGLSPLNYLEIHKNSPIEGNETQ